MENAITQQTRLGKILVIEDQPDIQLSAKLLLKKHFERVDVTDHPEAGWGSLQKEIYDVIVLDMNFSRGETRGHEGISWLKRFTRTYPASSVIAITAFGDLDLAVNAIKIGAFDFIVKPWDNNRLLKTVQEAFQVSRERKEKTSPNFLDNTPGASLIFNSAPMQKA